LLARPHRRHRAAVPAAAPSAPEDQQARGGGEVGAGEGTGADHGRRGHGVRARRGEVHVGRGRLRFGGGRVARGRHGMVRAARAVSRAPASRGGWGRGVVARRGFGLRGGWVWRKQWLGS
jgi:hypothetical protein